MRKHKYIELKGKEISELEGGYKKGDQSNYRQRCHAILLSSKGKKAEEIKEILGVKRTNTIRRWLCKWEKEGLLGLKDKSKTGRPRKLDVKNNEHVRITKKAVRAAVERGDKIHTKIEEELEINVSGRTLRRFLKNLNTNGKD